MNSSKKKSLIIDILLLIVLAIALGVSMVWSRTIELNLGLLYYVEVDNTDDADTLNGVYTSADGDSAELKVHFVDVGQGDCAIIELPDGKTMLIDGGENNKSTENAIQTFINKTLPSGFKYFDYAIMTHPDSDHCGSLDYVLNKYPARVCYRPNVEATGTTANPYTDPGKADLSSDVRTKNTAVYANAIKAMYYVSNDMTSVVYVTDPAVDEQSITGGEGDDAYSFTFYSPLTKKYGSNDWNNYSPVMILEYQGYKFAMSGDAEVKNLGEFVAKVNAAKTDGVTDKYDAFTDDYCVNVIKAGHHGSENATTLDYLNVLTTPSGAPDVYCVISCGAGNSYGHPHAAALDRYKTIGLPDENILRTDQKGDISFTVRMGEDGGYSMYYGDLKTENPNNPDDNPPDNPDDNPPDNPPDEPPVEVEEKKQILVYKKLGSIELKWAVVAWTVYAVIAVAGIIHILILALGSDSGKGGGRRKK